MTTASDAMADTDPCMGDGPLRFMPDRAKGEEALAHVVARWPGATPARASAALYLAERRHLNLHARPVFGGPFVAGPDGPVAAFLQRDGTLVPPGIGTGAAVVVGGRDPGALSRSDVACLDAAVALCRSMPASGLVDMLRRDPAWVAAGVGGTVDHAAMVDADNPHRDAVLREAREFAAFGVF